MRAELFGTSLQQVFELVLRYRAQADMLVWSKPGSWVLWMQQAFGSSVPHMRVALANMLYVLLELVVLVVGCSVVVTLQIIVAVMMQVMWFWRGLTTLTKAPMLTKLVSSVFGISALSRCQVILLWLSIIVVPRCSLWDVFVTTMDLMVMSAAVAAPFVCCQAIWMAVFMVQVVTQVKKAWRAGIYADIQHQVVPAALAGLSGLQVSSSHAPAPAVTRRVSLNVPEQGAVMSWMRIFTGCMVLHGVISLVDIPLTIMLESLKQDICAALKLIPVLVCMWMLVQVLFATALLRWLLLLPLFSSCCQLWSASLGVLLEAGPQQAEEEQAPEAPSTNDAFTQAPEPDSNSLMHHGPPLEVADAVQELTGMGFYDVLPGVPAPADPADMDVIIPWGTPMKKIAVHTPGFGLVSMVIYMGLMVLLGDDGEHEALHRMLQRVAQVYDFAGHLFEWCWTPLDPSFHNNTFGNYHLLPIEQLRHIRGVVTQTGVGVDDAEFLGCLSHLQSMHPGRFIEDLDGSDDDEDPFVSHEQVTQRKPAEQIAAERADEKKHIYKYCCGCNKMWSSGRAQNGHGPINQLVRFFCQGCADEHPQGCGDFALCILCAENHCLGRRHA